MQSYADIHMLVRPFSFVKIISAFGATLSITIRLHLRSIKAFNILLTALPAPVILHQRIGYEGCHDSIVSSRCYRHVPVNKNAVFKLVPTKMSENKCEIKVRLTRVIYFTVQDYEENTVRTKYCNSIFQTVKFPT